MKCAICGFAINSIEEAIEMDWIPFFLEGDDEHGPACESCSKKLLLRGSGGSYTLKDEFKGRIVYFDDMMDEVFGEEIALGFILN